MKNKIKKFAYTITSMGLVAPLAVFAQDGSRITDRSATAGLASGSIFDIIQQFMYWLLGIVGLLAIIGFLISSVLYLTAAGDESKLETAKKAMTYSIIGVVVALVGFVIVQAVSTLMTGDTGADQF